MYIILFPTLKYIQPGEIKESINSKTIWFYYEILWLPKWCSGKEPTCQCKRSKRHGLDPWVRKIPGGEHGSPLQYSCLENAMYRGAWQATVHRVTKSRT